MFKQYSNLKAKHPKRSCCTLLLNCQQMHQVARPCKQSLSVNLNRPVLHRKIFFSAFDVHLLLEILR